MSTQAIAATALFLSLTVTAAFLLGITFVADLWLHGLPTDEE